MTKNLKNKILGIENLERKIFWSFAFLIIAFSGLYIYLVDKTIVNVVERQSIEKQMASMGSSIGDLEASYLDLKNKINFDYALSNGFVKMSNEKYIARNAHGENLSVNRI